MPSETRVGLLKKRAELAAKIAAIDAVLGMFPDDDFDTTPPKMNEPVNDMVEAGGKTHSVPALVKAILQSSKGALLTPKEICSRVAQIKKMDASRSMYVSVFVACQRLQASGAITEGEKDGVKAFTMPKQ